MAIFRTRLKGPIRGGFGVHETICRSIKKWQKEVRGGLIYIPLTLQDPLRTGQDIRGQQCFFLSPQAFTVFKERTRAYEIKANTFQSPKTHGDVNDNIKVVG